MVNKNSGHSILEYLKKEGATNTFKLAHTLDIKRDKLLGIIKNLEEQRLIKIVTGKVEFLSYPASKEKKKQKPKIVVPKEKSEGQTLQGEVEKQRLYIEKLKAQIKKLEEKPPAEPVVEKVETEEIKPKPKRKIKIKEVKPKLIKTKPKKKPLLKFKQKRVKKTKKVKFKLKLPKFNIKKSLKFFKIKKIKLPKPKLKKLKKKPKIKIKRRPGLFKIKKFVKRLKRR